MRIGYPDSCAARNTDPGCRLSLSALNVFMAPLSSIAGIGIKPDGSPGTLSDAHQEPGASMQVASMMIPVLQGIVRPCFQPLRARMSPAG